MAKTISELNDSPITLHVPQNVRRLDDITIRVDWNKGNLFHKLFGKDVDLDLGCYYELRDGHRMVIDSIQFSHGRGGARNERTRQGCLTMPPYIWHTGDDPGHNFSSSETLMVNSAHFTEIKRIVVYAFIYEGIARWTRINARLTVNIPGCEPVEVRFGKSAAKDKFCAIAALDIAEDGTVEIKRLMTFHPDHPHCDAHYGWGFTYTEGRK